MASRMKMKKVTIVHFQKRWKRRTSTGAVTFFSLFGDVFFGCSIMFKPFQAEDFYEHLP